MGEMADRMINGEDCQWCGVRLDENEKVFDTAGNCIGRMPEDGSGFGIAICCEDCVEEEE
jgi:hypothetical protein